MGRIAGGFEAEDHALSLLHILNQVIDLEGLATNGNYRVILRVDLPIAIIVVDIKIPHCFLSVTTPSLQSDQQLLYVRVSVGKIKVIG